jgi:hypothetical protein
MMVVDEQLVRDSYPYLAVQRNLQIIGAFAFLSMARGKPFFFAYLMPALTGLDRRLLHHPEFASFVLLRSTVSAARERFAKKYRALAAQWGEKEEQECQRKKQINCPRNQLLRWWGGRMWVNRPCLTGLPGAGGPLSILLRG